ncbi:T9SS type A sorting domain-containing protein [Saccharicrinis sp. 156]|uniref:T9SS type A sorting domain-containing protein n=1 Tax=Saccharicrinis sp. 156 TaxID=3417574 RepID=UPI003D329502
MKISLLFIGVLLALSLGLKAQNYDGGSGTSDDPYQIATADQLVTLANTPAHWSGKSFILTENIDMNGKSFTPIGSMASIFTGNFNGNAKTISNLTVTPVPVFSEPDGYDVVRNGTGLFGAFNGTLEKLGLINPSITVTAWTNSSKVGALVGQLDGGIVSKCYSLGGNINCNGGWTGGLIGVLWEGGTNTVEDCYSTSTVSASWRSAGVVGCTRGEHKINRIAFYGSTNTDYATVSVHPEKGGISPTNSVYSSTSGGTETDATSLDAAALLVQSNYPTFDFDLVWEMNTANGYAVLKNTFPEPELTFWEKLQKERVESSDLVEWKQFGPGMSGYNEEFWCHPTEAEVMFMGPDMHVAYGSWDNGETWQTLKDSDGDGLDLERVNDLTFSKSNPDFGVAIERRGKVFITNDMGRNWKQIYYIPHAAESPWYNAHSRVVIDPNDDNTWYIGAGGFWDVKGNWRSAANPQGTHRPISAYGYILKTTDGGSTFKKIATGIDDMLDVGRIRVHPENSNRILIATGQGMFLSTDGGTTWNPSNTGLPNNLPKDLDEYYDPSTGEYILYTVEQSVYTQSGNTIATKGGVFKSTDGGENWTNITGDLGLDFNQITNGTFRDNYNKLIAYWLGVDKSIIAAKDFPTNTLQVFRRLVVNPKNKNEIYLFANQRHDKSFGPGDIWKSADGGQSWKIVTKHGTYWHAGSDAGYWSGKGMTTTPNVDFAHLQASLDESLESSSACRHLAINVNGDVFIGINQQTQRSIDGGDSWQQIDDIETSPGSGAWIGRGDSNLPGRFILSKTGIPDRMLLCSGEHGLWQTADIEDYADKDAVAVTQIEGQVHDINGNHGAHSVSTVAVHPNDPNTIFILAWRQEHRGWLRKSTDGGKTWHNVVQIFDTDNGSWEATASQYCLKIDPVNPENMYFTAIYKPISCGTNSGPGEDLTMGEYGVYRSTDGGNTWTASNDWIPAGGSVNRIILHPDNPETLFAALNQWSNNDPYGLYKSTDKAVNWSKMTIPSPIRSVNNIYIDPNTKYMYISCGARTGDFGAGGVYRSKDEGETWELFFEAPYVWHVETSPVNSDIILVNAAGQVGGTFKNPGFYLSQDDGETWVRINKGLGQPDKMVDIEFDPYNENIIYSAAWGSGWYKGIIKTDEVKAVCADATVNMGEEITLYAHGSIGSQLEYDWTVPSEVTDAEINKYKVTFTAPNVQNDSVMTFTLNVGNGLGSDEIAVQVTVKKIDTAVKYPRRDGLVIYPNPAESVLFVKGINEEANYSLVTSAGDPMLTTNDTRIDLSSLVDGCYLLRIETEDLTTYHKFIKK